MTIDRNVEIKIRVDTRALQDGLSRANAALRGNFETFNQTALATLQRLSDIHHAGSKAAKAPAKASKNKYLFDGLFGKVTPKSFSVAIFDPIRRGFDQMVTGMLKGTETFRMAWRRMVQDMVLSYLQGCIKVGIQTVETDAANTLALAMGIQTRKGMQTSAMAEEAALHIASAVKWIAVEAGKVLAGVTAFLAPEIGPAAPAGGAAAAAATIAAAGSIAFAAGGFDVPADTLTYLHKREMVLPAELADTVRGMAAVGGGRGLSANIAVHAMDGASVMRTLTANSGAVAAALRRHVRDLGQL